jgi:hypothetical protein
LCDAQKKKPVEDTGLVENGLKRLILIQGQTMCSFGMLGT